MASLPLLIKQLHGGALFSAILEINRSKSNLLICCLHALQNFLIFFQIELLSSDFHLSAAVQITFRQTR
jgi:hypothetical protein